MELDTAYPTTEHSNAADEIVDFFRAREGVEAVLLVNSCARGKASRDSCLDIAVLLDPDVFNDSGAALETKWQEHLRSASVFQRLKSVGRYSVVHLYFTGGEFVPGEREEFGEPDQFEIEVGNCLVYSVPLWNRSRHFAELQERWLPYYDDSLRQRRLSIARWHCLNDLDHIPLFIDRGLYFQAFGRLQFAFKSFLQGLFIAHRKYPIAYDKWIKEQVVEVLKLPELYGSLPTLFELDHFESREMSLKALDLKRLVGEYLENST